MALEEVRLRYARKAGLEWDRLGSTPVRRIEYLITRHSLDRYLPGSELILDAGSGPGRYAIDLARLGYRVVMFDLLLEMLQFGQKKISEQNLHRSIMLTEGDVMALPYPDNQFDAVISLGAPLSHILKAEGRATVVNEITRVVKPGGLVFLTGLTRLACYRGAIYWIDNAGFIEQVIKPDYWTDGISIGSQVWYNFAPEELEILAQSAGLEVIDRIGCEGLANNLPSEGLEQIENDPRYWDTWKEILLRTCNEPSIIGISNHLMVVGRK